jgi:NADPH-dependent glutamate synthase beta subunit-like oxidoreductase
VLSKKAKDALDDMAKGLKDQKGYIVEIQGFSAGRGESAIESSQRMADAVRRYMVINNDVPVYRVHVLGLGNTPMPSSDGTAKRVRGARVEVSLLKNDLEQLSTAQPTATGSSSTEGGVSGTATQPPSSTTTQQPASNGPASNMNAPASSNAPATAQPDSSVPPQQGASPSTPPQQSKPPQQ